ncbi:hypothetical protein Cni_G24703 [Canna indica]|uniref:Uncharacterized protein n=1 Tax=Canna indica TaxID=4628 RepID=A0AAQ3KYL2_9LILI|nr:hypothetical protein Cni_G24703 [Canna indica]
MVSVEHTQDKEKRRNIMQRGFRRQKEQWNIFTSNLRVKHACMHVPTGRCHIMSSFSLNSTYILQCLLSHKREGLPFLSFPFVDIYLIDEHASGTVRGTHIHHGLLPSVEDCAQGTPKAQR